MGKNGWQTAPDPAGELRSRRCPTETELLRRREAMPTRPREGGPTPTPHNGRFRTQPAGTAGRASAAPTVCRRRVAGDPAGARRRRKPTRCLGNKTSWQEVSISDGANDESSGDRPDGGGRRSCGAMGHREAIDRRHWAGSPGVPR